jgi:hypothetical protein
MRIEDEERVQRKSFLARGTPTMMRWSFDARSGKDLRCTRWENRKDDE